MVLPVPLSVRLVNAKTDRHIERDLYDLTFRSVVPGGFASASMSLNRPLASQPDEIGYYTQVIIYDTRNGQTVWEGRLEDPGRGTDSSGETWDLAAVGPSAHAQDNNQPVIYCDRRLDGAWEVFEQRSSSNATTQFAEDASGNPVMRLAPTSNTINAGWRANMIYQPIRITGQVVARVQIGWDSGWTSAFFTVRVQSLDSANVATTVNNTTVNTAGGSLPGVYSTDIPAGDDKVTFDLVCPGGSAGIDDTTWVVGLVHCVRAALHTATGSLITTGYTADTVLASEIIKDLLGTVLDQYDGANAVVTTTSYTIDQAVYPDGATAHKIFEDMMALEPDYYWAAWEKNPSTDLYRFEWVPWSDTITYEASTVDGYSSSGSADGLFNKVRIRWRSATGFSKTNTDTSTVAELDDAGLTREAFMDLSDEIGSSANADRVAAQFLTDHADAPNQGRLTISRPVMNYDTGIMVQPWELRPGNLIRVRGILANSDALNATSRDGVTVFKIIAVDFNASTGSATLELDTQPRTLDHLLAEIKNIPAARWRERWR